MKLSDLKNPISALNSTMAFVWVMFSIGGAALALFEGSALIAKVGGLMLSMCAGYMFFGLGIQRSDTSEQP